MGMFRDFANAFKEEANKPVLKQAQPQRNPKYQHVPVLVHQCMTHNTVDVRASRYFADAVAKLPYFKCIQFKVAKATKKNVPPNWSIDDGDASVFSPTGEIVGKLDAKRFGQLGGKTGKYYGFVEPPSYDYEEGHGITPEPRIFIFCDYSAVYNGGRDVIIGWKP